MTYEIKILLEDEATSKLKREASQMARETVKWNTRGQIVGGGEMMTVYCFCICC